MEAGEKCYIEGHMDFIFGYSAAVFDTCCIHSKAPGYIVAHARTAPDEPTGYVFRNCNLTGATEPDKVYLGRPWRPYSRVVFISCRMGAHIRRQGWDNWRNKENESTAWFAEYDSQGPGASSVARVPWAHQLKKNEVSIFDIALYLKRDDGWVPPQSRVIREEERNGEVLPPLSRKKQ